MTYLCSCVILNQLLKLLKQMARGSALFPEENKGEACTLVYSDKYILYTVIFRAVDYVNIFSE